MFLFREECNLAMVSFQRLLVVNFGNIVAESNLMLIAKKALAQTQTTDSG